MTRERKRDKEIVFKSVFEGQVLNEKEVLNWMQSVVASKITIPTNPYSRYDASTTNAIIEIKSRNAVYDSVLIEKTKYDVLTLYASEQRKSVLYIVADASGLFAFDLFDLDFTDAWQQVYLNKTYNVGNPGDQPHKWKWVSYIPKSAAIVLLEGDAYQEALRIFKDSDYEQSLLLTY